MNPVITKVAVFAVVTVLGVSYTAYRYLGVGAGLITPQYEVALDLPASGGIFEGAEVTYRGVGVGRVETMELSEGGVRVGMRINNESNPIPSDVEAVVANRSAVGEQYVDLQPTRTGGPYLQEGDTIPRSDTRTPLPTTTLLTNLNSMVNSVDRDNLRTVVDEMGAAFGGTGKDLGQIIDTSNSFIETADNYFDLTAQLIRDGRVVLQTQVDSESAIQTFSTNLALLSDTLVRSDEDIRHVIDSGGTAANVMRDFIVDNRANLSQLLGNLVTSGEVTVARLHGIEQLLVLYPYVVEGGYTVIAKDPVSGLYDAHFGLVLTQDPHVCKEGYETTEQRPPQELEEVPFNTAAHCAEPASQSSARGAQNAPAPLNRAPVVATYDPGAGRLAPAEEDPMANVASSGSAARALGQDSWKWLLLGPLAGRR